MTAPPAYSQAQLSNLYDRDLTLWCQNTLAQLKAGKLGDQFQNVLTNFSISLAMSVHTWSAIARLCNCPISGGNLFR